MADKVTFWVSGYALHCCRPDNQDVNAEGRDYASPVKSPHTHTIVALGVGSTMEAR